MYLTSESLKKTNVSAQFTKSIHDKLCSSWKLKCRQVATLWTSDLTQLEFSLADLTQLEFSLAKACQIGLC